ncbi:hypothetical protein HK405_002087, partial [Cladochytrium tenue]
MAPVVVFVKAALAASPTAAASAGAKNTPPLLSSAASISSTLSSDSTSAFQLRKVPIDFDPDVATRAAAGNSAATSASSSSYFVDLERRLCAVLPVSPPLTLTYRDEDGDDIEIDSESELVELLQRIALSGPTPSVRVSVSERKFGDDFEIISSDGEANVTAVSAGDSNAVDEVEGPVHNEEDHMSISVQGEEKAADLMPIVEKELEEAPYGATQNVVTDSPPTKTEKTLFEDVGEMSTDSVPVAGASSAR